MSDEFHYYGGKLAKWAYWAVKWSIIFWVASTVLAALLVVATIVFSPPMQTKEGIEAGERRMQDMMDAALARQRAVRECMANSGRYNECNR